jgi:hypothetical protein
VEEIKYFFSYARRDSEFVLKLAKELREAGATLWLDQLDILGGQRWDRAIEEALGACQGMIVVLSPESLASNNVMDEVSYALEQGKLVVPILLRSGTIPFRLRRVQHVDFTAGYDTGFSQLLRSLHIAQRRVTTQPPASNKHIIFSPPRRRPVQNIDAPLPPPPSASRPSKEHQAQRATAVLQAETIRPKNPNRRILTAIILAVLGAIWGGAVVAVNGFDPNSWPAGAGIVGLAGAITGLISGKRFGIIVLAIVGMIIGFGVVMAVGGSPRFVISAGVFGVSVGGIVGAIFGVIIKMLRNLMR